jgi:hypothetical protein
MHDSTVGWTDPLHRSADLASLFCGWVGGQGPADGPSLGNSLETLLLRVLFDVWLRSGIVDPALWKTFAKFAGRWVHRRCFLTEWRHTSFALTRKLLRLLYDGATSNDPISIRWTDNYTTVVMLTDKKVRRAFQLPPLSVSSFFPCPSPPLRSRSVDVS